MSTEIKSPAPSGNPEAWTGVGGAADRISEIIEREAQAEPGVEGTGLAQPPKREQPAVKPPGKAEDALTLNEAADEMSRIAKVGTAEEQSWGGRESTGQPPAEEGPPQPYGMEKKIEEMVNRGRTADQMLQQEMLRFDQAYAQVPWHELSQQNPQEYARLRGEFQKWDQRNQAEHGEIKALEHQVNQGLMQHQQGVQVKALFNAKVSALQDGRRHLQDLGELHRLRRWAESQGWTLAKLQAEPMSTWYQIADEYKATRAQTAKVRQKGKPVDERPGWRKRTDERLKVGNIRDRNGTRATEIRMQEIMGGRGFAL